MEGLTGIGKESAEELQVEASYLFEYVKKPEVRLFKPLWARRESN